MARLSKEITVAGKRVEVRELTVREIRNFWNTMGNAAGQGLDSLGDELKKFMPTCITGLPIEDLDDLTPTELKVVYDAFQEVNKVFFDVAQIVEGNHPLLMDLRLSILSDLIVKFAGLSRKGTQGSSITDSASSSGAPKEV